MTFQKLNDPPPDWLVELANMVCDLIWKYDARARFQCMMQKWKAEKGEGPTDFVAPLPNRELALDEMYVLLAAVHDEFCLGVKQLNLWVDPMDDPVKRRLIKRRDNFTYSEFQARMATIPYCAVCANLRAFLPQRDAARIEHALRIVEADLKQDCKKRGKELRSSMFEGAEAVRQTVVNDKRTYINNDFSVHHNDNSVHNESHDNRSFHETNIISGTETRESLKKPAADSTRSATNGKQKKTRRSKKLKTTAQFTPNELILVETLIEHHKYENGSCKNWTPIGVRELEKKTTIGKSQVSDFFTKWFKSDDVKESTGYPIYKMFCNSKDSLISSLSMLSGECTPAMLYKRLASDYDVEDHRYGKDGVPEGYDPDASVG